MLKFSPAVFAVGKDYQIVVTSKSQSFISIKVGNELFVDDSNGILCSSSHTHKFNIPQELLNSEKHYTVIEKCIIKRLPYFSRTHNDRFFEFDFKPVEGDSPRCYHIADAHNDSEKTVQAAKVYGDIDFLILNGDIPNDSGNIRNFDTVFEICDKITGGTIPVVFARGNHDLRGICAEKFAQYTPAKNGNTYYTWRLGSIWGICLDCGEDKEDYHAEYGNTVCCHIMRQRETKMLKSVIDNAENEYAEGDVKLRLVVVHNPFTFEYPEPFNIEKEIYSEWARILKDYIKPNLMICGHTHEYSISYPGDESDYLGHPCPVIVAAELKGDEHAYGGTGIRFDGGKAEITYTKSNGFTDTRTIEI